MNRTSRLSSARRRPVHAGGAVAAILAIVLNLILPLALAAGERAGDAFDFTAAICHGGAAVVATSAGGTANPHPLDGVAGHDCCVACLTPLAHALMPPPAAVIVDIVAPPRGRDIHRVERIPADPGQLSFRSRAPPVAG